MSAPFIDGFAALNPIANHPPAGPDIAMSSIFEAGSVSQVAENGAPLGRDSKADLAGSSWEVNAVLAAAAYAVEEEVGVALTGAAAGEAEAELDAAAPGEPAGEAAREVEGELAGEAAREDEGVPAGVPRGELPGDRAGELEGVADDALDDGVAEPGMSVAEGEGGGGGVPLGVTGTRIVTLYERVTFTK